MKTTTGFVIIMLALLQTFAQSTFVKRISFNYFPNSQYMHPEDSSLQLLDVEKCPDGNTLILIESAKGQSDVCKLDLNGRIIFQKSAASQGHLSSMDVNFVHPTQNGGCIYASNNESWITSWQSFSTIEKVDNTGQSIWTAWLPSIAPLPATPQQITYDVAVLPNGNFACLAMDSIYFLNSGGNPIGTLNFNGPGMLFAFSNGDLYLECGSFKGRMHSDGTPVWQTSSPIYHNDTTLYKIASGSMQKLDGMTGNVLTTAPFTQTGLSNITMMQDGGWCCSNATTIERYDANGISEWTETISLPRFGMTAIGETSDGMILCGGAYRSRSCTWFNYDISAFVGTIDSSGHSVLDSTDQVWPGDANDDGLVEFGDAIYIALAQGSTGPSRLDSNILFGNSNYDSPWCGGYEYGDIGTDFSGNFATGINHKQCDVIPDGIIDSLDIIDLTTKITQYNFVPSWRMGSPGNDQEQNTIPFFSMVPEQDTVFAGDTVRVYFILGDNGVIIDSIFGLAFQFDRVLSGFYGKIECIGAQHMDSDLGQSGDLNFLTYLPNLGFMFSRKNLQNAYGVQDTIGYMDVKISDTLSAHSTINLTLASLKAITAGGFTVDFQINSLAISARSIIASSPEIQLNKISISPNPASHQLTLNHLPENDLLIRIFNSQGKICISRATKTSNTLSLNLDNLDSGIYFIRISDSESNEFSMKFIKN